MQYHDCFFTICKSTNLFVIVALFAQFIIPLPAEASHQRLLEIAVEGDALLASFGDSAAADVPFVVVHRFELAKVLDTHRVEMARDGLSEIRLTVEPSLLDGTQRQAVLKDSVGAFAVCDKRRAGQSVNIHRRHSFIFHNLDPSGGHIRLHLGENPFKHLNLILFERGSAVAFHTTCALATIQVAAEPDLFEIVRYYTVVNNFHVNCEL